MSLGNVTLSHAVRLAAVAALTLATVTVTVLPGQAAGPVRAAAPAAQDEVSVDYGQIVRVPIVDHRTGAVTLRFDGRRGKRVALTDDYGRPPCLRATLSSRGQRVSRDELGFWRLPRTGTYTLDVRHHCTEPNNGGGTYASSIQVALHRLVVHRAERGELLDARSEGPTMHAYRVPVSRRDGGASLETTGYGTFVARASRLDRPGRDRTDGSEWCQPDPARGSMAMGTAPNRWECPWTMPRRDEYLVTGVSPVRIRPFVYSDARVDGAATRWNGDTPRILTFRAKAGSYVRISTANLDIHPPPPVPNDTVKEPAYRTFGRSLDYVAGFFDADARVHHLLLRVTSSGLQSINLYKAQLRDADAGVSVRVRTVAHTVLQPGVATPLRVEGDRWAVATIPALLGVPQYSLAARFSVTSATGVADGWAAHFMGSRGIYGTEADAKRRQAVLTAPGTSEWLSIESRDLNGVIVTPGPGNVSGTVTAQFETTPPTP